MLRLALVILLWSLQVVAQDLQPRAAEPRCDFLMGDLFNMTFDFEPDIALNSSEYLVRWKGHEFRLTPSQFLLVELVLTATHDSVSWDQLIMEMYGENECELPERTLKVQLCHVRKAFRAVDPDFDRLKARYKGGLFWDKDQRVEKVQVGRLSVAVHLNLAWLDDQEIKLQPAQQNILLRLAEAQSKGVKASLFIDSISAKSIVVHVSNLNQLFGRLLGERLIITFKNEAGLTTRRLNLDLLSQPRPH